MFVNVCQPTRSLNSQLLNGLLEGNSRHMVAHNASDLAAQVANLGGLSIVCLLCLVGHLGSEGNDKHTQSVSILCLDVDVGIDSGLPLADQRSELVSGQLESVEVGQGALVLDILNAELDVAVGLLFVSLEISEADRDHTSLEVVMGVL